ncbi:MAG: A/G-specific adenine glycosylase [bacterium]
MFSTDEVASVRQSLIDWYRRDGRNLPWREDAADPYRIVVSEMMLVQTTVTAVIPYYHRFLSRFPTVVDLATADVADVLKMWEGLGYYRRAHQLHRMAQTVLNEHGGQFPPDERQLLALPGIGRYIAGAVRSFAFNQPAPILEANTIRVHARLSATRENVAETAVQKKLWQQAELLVDPQHPGLFNQAIMDLGAMVCTPDKPSCLVCPVSSVCRSYQKGLTDLIPQKAAKKPPKIGSEAAILITRSSDDAVLLAQRPAGGLWSEFWEIPTFWLSGADPARRSESGWACEDNTENIANRLGRLISPKLAEIALTAEKSITYAVTTHKMNLSLYTMSIHNLNNNEILTYSPNSSLRFIPRPEIKKLTTSAPHRVLLRHLGLR